MTNAPVGQAKSSNIAMGRFNTTLGAFCALICLPTGLWAGGLVTLSLSDGSFSVTGPLLGYDATNYTVETEYGPLVMSKDTTICQGAACPPVAGGPLRIVGDAGFVTSVLPDLPAQAQALVTGHAKPLAIALGDLRAGRADFVVTNRFLNARELGGPHVRQAVIAQAPMRLFARDDTVPTALNPQGIAKALDAGAGPETHKIGGSMHDIMALRQYLFLDPIAPLPTGPYAMGMDADDAAGHRVRFTSVCGSDDAGHASPEMLRPVVLIYDQRTLSEPMARFVKSLRQPAAQSVLARHGYTPLFDPTQSGPDTAQWARSLWLNSDAAGLRQTQNAVHALASYTKLPIELHVTDSGVAGLDALSLAKLKVLANAAKAGDYDGQTLIFAGFSDTSGTRDTNMQISAQRANFVRDQFRAMVGPAVVAKLTLNSTGLGPAMPRYCNDFNWGRQHNRRVEIWVRP